MYHVIDDDQVHEQVTALPAQALSAYAQARTLLEIAPWSGSPYRKDKPDGPMRTLPFGSSGGVVYLILEQQREVHVLLVVWISLEALKLKSYGARELDAAS